MKKIIIFSLSIFFILSCSNDDDSNVDLIGEWKLVEILIDPGDGSGTFNPVDSDKTITFNPLGTWTSNASICNTSTESDAPSAGTYDLEGYTINSPSCNTPDLEYPFQQNGNTLIISYFCFEGCQEKYRKQ